MATYAQNSCTLSTVTDVRSIYTYHLLVPSTMVVTNNMAPKDATAGSPGNPPGASSITITYLGDDYVWTISEPGINIQTNDVGTLYYIECTLFSDNTFDWGPIMTSSSYEAAKQAFNKATIVSNLVGDSPQHFWWLTTEHSTGIPAGAYITYVSQESFKSSPNNQPNLLLQSEGISLRNGLTTKAQMTSTGLEVLEGGIKGGQAGGNGFIYLSTEDYPLKNTQSSPTVAGLTINEYTPSAAGTDGREIDDPAWRQIIGTKFGVDSEGNLYASDVNIKGKITATSGEIGGAQIENGRLIVPYSNINFLSTDKISAEHLDLSSKLDTNDGSGGRASWNNGVFTVSSFSSANQTQYSIEISGTGIKFKYNDIESASIDQDKLIIGKTVVLDEMQIGTNKWTWKINPFDNSIYLKWLG